LTQTIEKLQKENLTLEVARLFPCQGEWTEEDYFNLPETNRIVELSEGKLIISPSPTPRHQKVSFKLSLLLGNYVLANTLGEVVTSPMDVRLWKGKIRQPDIAFMSNEHKKRITRKFWGIPDLVVEIISKGTKKQDMVDKFNEYQKAGITEYWIVDLSKETIEIFALENKAYIQLGKWNIGETAHSKVIDGLQVELDKVFE